MVVCDTFLTIAGRGHHENNSNHYFNGYIGAGTGEMVVIIHPGATKNEHVFHFFVRITRIDRFPIKKKPLAQFFVVA